MPRRSANCRPPKQLQDLALRVLSISSANPAETEKEGNHKMKRVALAFGLALAASVAQAGIIQTVEDSGIYTTQVAGATTVNWNNNTCGAYTSCTGNGALVTGSVSGRYASPYGITDRYLTVPRDYGAGAVSLTTPG